MEITDIITPELLGQILVGILGLVTTFLASAGVRLLRAKTTDAQFKLLQDIAFEAVKAAEQSGLSGVIDDKKQYAYATVASIAKDYGIKVTPEQIDMTIESAVLEEFNRAIAYEASVEKAKALRAAEATASE